VSIVGAAKIVEEIVAGAKTVASPDAKDKSGDPGEDDMTADRITSRTPELLAAGQPVTVIDVRSPSDVIGNSREHPVDA